MGIPTSKKEMGIQNSTYTGVGKGMGKLFLNGNEDKDLGTLTYPPHCHS